MVRREDLDGVVFAEAVAGAALPPLTPGEVLLEEFVRPAGLTARGLAAELGLPGSRISAIVAGSRGITAETAILLGRRFKTSAELWMNLQSAHDLSVARAEKEGEAAVRFRSR